jgi:hypothetical protein
VLFRSRLRSTASWPRGGVRVTERDRNELLLERYQIRCSSALSAVKRVAVMLEAATTMPDLEAVIRLAVEAKRSLGEAQELIREVPGAQG